MVIIAEHGGATLFLGWSDAKIGATPLYRTPLFSLIEIESFINVEILL